MYHLEREKTLSMKHITRTKRESDADLSRVYQYCNMWYQEAVGCGTRVFSLTHISHLKSAGNIVPLKGQLMCSIEGSFVSIENYTL